MGQLISMVASCLLGESEEERIRHRGKRNQQISPPLSDSYYGCSTILNSNHALKQTLMVPPPSLASSMHSTSTTSNGALQRFMVTKSKHNLPDHSSIRVSKIDSNGCNELDRFKVNDRDIEVSEDKGEVFLHVPRMSLGGQQRKKEEKIIKKIEVKGKWVQHYCNSQRILLVGEGDFSFSASLARGFGSASNMVATSLDSIEFLCTNYKNSLSNINGLRSLGCVVIHGLDATRMATDGLLKMMTFDRIIFNFPHAGFKREDRDSSLRRHQKLIRLFLRNAKKMINSEGEIHITHKSYGFFLEWKLEYLASNVGLRLIDEIPLNLKGYKGYHPKYGFGGDKNFNCHSSKTYKFGICPTLY